MYDLGFMGAYSSGCSGSRFLLCGNRRSVCGNDLVLDVEQISLGSGQSNMCVFDVWYCPSSAKSKVKNYILSVP